MADEIPADAAAESGAPPPGPKPSRFEDRKPRREDVRGCYRYILGREPENEGVLDRQMASATTIREIRYRLLASEEFRTRGLPKHIAATLPIGAGLPVDAPALAVDTEASSGDLGQMLARIAAGWAELGRTQPHYSVLTQDRFAPDQIEENRARFQATGAADLALLLGALARAGIPPSVLPVVVEYGCGVGRVTAHLAGAFRRVTGCDISPPHLAIAGQALGALGLRNVALHQSVPGELMPRPPWNLWYSRLVLQHNPPPVMTHVLRQAFAGLAPGGIVAVQVPTYAEGYAFKTSAYLATPPATTMEMHVLPQRAIFGIAAQQGADPLEVRDDSGAVGGAEGRWQSQFFVFRRR